MAQHAEGEPEGTHDPLSGLSAVGLPTTDLRSIFVVDHEVMHSLHLFGTQFGFALGQLQLEELFSVRYLTEHVPEVRRLLTEGFESPLALWEACRRADPGGEPPRFLLRARHARWLARALRAPTRTGPPIAATLWGWASLAERGWELTESGVHTFDEGNLSPIQYFHRSLRASHLPERRPADGFEVDRQMLSRAAIETPGAVGPPLFPRWAQSLMERTTGPVGRYEQVDLSADHLMEAAATIAELPSSIALRNRGASEDLCRVLSEDAWARIWSPDGSASVALANYLGRVKPEFRGDPRMFSLLVNLALNPPLCTSLWHPDDPLMSVLEFVPSYRFLVLCDATKRVAAPSTDDPTDWWRFADLLFESTGFGKTRWIPLSEMIRRAERTRNIWRQQPAYQHALELLRPMSDFKRPDVAASSRFLRFVLFLELFPRLGMPTFRGFGVGPVARALEDDGLPRLLAHPGPIVYANSVAIPCAAGVDFVGDAVSVRVARLVQDAGTSAVREMLRDPSQWGRVRGTAPERWWDSATLARLVNRHLGAELVYA